MIFLKELDTLKEIMRVIVFVKKIMNIIFFIVPMLLIVMLSLDFFKSSISNSDDNMRKNIILAIKRIIAAILLFLVPTITNMTMSVLTYAGVKGAAYYNLAIEENLNSEVLKKINIDEYINNYRSGIISSSSNSSSSKSKMVVDGETYRLKNDFIVLANIRNNDAAKKYKLVKYTIEILNSKNLPQPATNFIFKSENPGIATVSANGVVTANFGGTTNIIVKHKNDLTKSVKLKVTVVHSLYTKVKTTKKLTVTNMKTGQSITLSKGTKGVYNGLAEKDLHRNYFSGNTLKVGNNYYKVDVEDVKHYGYKINEKVDKKTAEEFVNSHNFKSKTKYLFWSNQGTQYEYIFTGSKKNWKLYKVFKISTGDALGYKIPEGNTHGNSGTGTYPDMYVMGSIAHTSYGGSSFPHGYIPKNDGASGYHEYGGTRQPKTHGCTAFKLKDLKWFTSNLSKIKKSQIVTI